jgi:hypothetical protein
MAKMSDEERLKLAQQAIKDALDKCAELGICVFDVDYRRADGSGGEVEFDNLGFEIWREMP